LLPGQLWYNPCTCTYYFACPGNEEEINNCEDLVPLNYRPGAGIGMSGDCETGHFLSVRIEPNTGLAFTGLGELTIDCASLVQHCDLWSRTNLTFSPTDFITTCSPIGNCVVTLNPARVPTALPAVEKISYAVADGTNVNIDESVMVGSVNSISLVNPFPYPIKVVEQVHLAEVNLFNNSAYPASLGALLERSADGVVWYPNSIGIRNPWISVQVGQAEEIMGSLYNTVHTVPANSTLTVHIRCKRIVRSYSTAPDRLTGLSVPFAHIECLMFQI
jgi:hypothetical protein